MSDIIQPRGLSVILEGKKVPVNSINAFHFSIPYSNDLENGTNYSAVLQTHSGDELTAQIRTRHSGSQSVHCRFSDISLQNRSKLDSWLEEWDGSAEAGDSLNKLSYDQIAKGDTGDGTFEEPTKTKPAKLTNSFVKSAPVLVFLAMILIAVGIVGGFVFIAKKRNHIKISNGSLMGNYLPIQAAETGIIKESMVTEGDFVMKGDVLFAVGSTDLEEEAALAQASLVSAEAEVSALKQLIESHKKKFQIAVNNAAQKIMVAKAEEAKAVELAMAQEKVIETMELVYKRRVIYDVNYQKEKAALNGYQSDILVKRKVVGEEVAALDGMLEGGFAIMGQNIDDKLSEHQADLTIAEAEVVKAKTLLRITQQKMDRLNVRAPADGQVFAIYRHDGEYIKIADPVLSLSVRDRAWAFGSVELGSAHRIRPGQSVRVTIPAMNDEVTGRIAAVGHRSVYTEGGWSQDFKVDPYSIPIKVWLPDMVGNPPTGIRLKMNVNLPFRWPWEEEDDFDPNSLKRAIVVNEQKEQTTE